MMFSTLTPLAPYGPSAVPCARTPDPTLFLISQDDRTVALTIYLCKARYGESNKKHVGFAARRSAIPTYGAPSGHTLRSNVTLQRRL